MFPVRYEYYLHIQIPVPGLGGLYGCEMMIPRFLDSRLPGGGEVVSLTRRLRSTPQQYFLFLTLVLISGRG
jgi:hypothetical protein